MVYLNFSWIMGSHGKVSKKSLAWQMGTACFSKINEIIFLCGKAVHLGACGL